MKATAKNNLPTHVSAVSQMLGGPRTRFERLGPFALKISSKVDYMLYEIILEDGISILKQASRPGLQDACYALSEALRAGKIHQRLYTRYIEEVNRELGNFMAAKKR